MSSVLDHGARTSRVITSSRGIADRNSSYEPLYSLLNCRRRSAGGAGPWPHECGFEGWPPYRARKRGRPPRPTAVTAHLTALAAPERPYQPG